MLEKTDKPGSIGPIVLRENYDPTINQYLRLSNVISHSGQNCFVITTNIGNSVRGNIYTNILNGENVRGSVKLKAGKYVISAWIREGINSTATKLSYTNSEIRIIVDANTPISLKPKGNILDGWQRISGEFDIPANVNKVDIEFVGINNSSYFDDLRIHPFNANMKSFVYDPITLRLVAELDENNYPTYYEYDKAGNLSHVKKVTEKGVQTVKEVRAGTVKKLQ